jgi:hypothetical protein
MCAETPSIQEPIAAVFVEPVPAGFGEAGRTVCSCVGAFTERSGHVGFHDDQAGCVGADRGVVEGLLQVPAERLAQIAEPLGGVGGHRDDDASWCGLVGADREGLCDRAGSLDLDLRRPLADGRVDRLVVV